MDLDFNGISWETMGVNGMGPLTRWATADNPLGTQREFPAIAADWSKPTTNMVKDFAFFSVILLP